MELVLNAFFMLLNISSGVLMVCLSRVLMTSYDFAFAATVTGFHFWAAALAMKMAECSGLVEKGSMPFKSMAVYSLVGAISVASANVSLLLNSVGFYQISKLLVVPFVCGVEMTCFSRTVTMLQMTFIAVVMLGVGMVTVTDVAFNLVGALVALLYIISSGCQQVLCGSWQGQFKLASHQLLSLVSPMQGAFLIGFGPTVDYLVTDRWLSQWIPNVPTINFILLTCVVAVLVNLSQFICLGRISVTSFQVLGHAKTILILLGGWLFLGDVMNLKKALGLIVAISGMVGYTSVVSSQRTGKKETKLQDAESNPLLSHTAFRDGLSRKQGNPPVAHINNITISSPRKSFI